MDAGEKIVKTLADGEGVRTDADIRLQFIGREWSVLSFIGKQENGGALLIGEVGTSVDPADVVRLFLSAACACACSTGMPPQELLRIMAVVMVETSKRMKDYEAARGKPS